MIFAESGQAVAFSALVQGGETPSSDEPCAPTTFTGTGTIRAFDNTMIIVASGITAICTRETIRLNLTRE
ncbi:MAG: hypothetical protein HYV62_12920 [Candidatus Rokubacteria bacterium]|nr:hypothetical protein [Candidatus Rokubacteria bacterium]